MEQVRTVYPVWSIISLTVVLPNRERMTEIVFERFNSPAFYLALGDCLAAYASGRTTTTVVSVGSDVTNITPIYEGFPVSHAIRQFYPGGEDITSYLMKILAERGYTDSIAGSTLSWRLFTQDIKEKLGYVALDFESEIYTSATSGVLEKSYELPDGQVITVGNERFRSAEALFQPSMLGLESSGLDVQTFSAISKVDIDIKKEMFESITLVSIATRRYQA
jgi:actin